MNRKANWRVTASWLLAAGVLAAGGVRTVWTRSGPVLAVAPSTAAAADWTKNTPYYEDDAWYDISEWFDGNDYNPTDEVWWRWDDEKYQASQDTGGDHDRDSWYGYDGRANGSGGGTGTSSWFYDYYDPYAYYYNGDPTRGLERYGVQYYDYDRDGTYDAYMTFSDKNRDGLYDAYHYYSFDTSSSQKDKGERARQNAPKEAREQAVTGQVGDVKEVRVRGEGKHLVVRVDRGQAKQQQGGEGGKAVVADLGLARDVKDLNLKGGDEVTVHGPRVRVGDKSVILATSVESGGQTKQIDREGRQVQGKVLSTHKTKVRGSEHMIAMVDATRSGSDKSSKVAVDLGPADKLGAEVSKGKSLTFTAVPVKVKDKRMLMAQSVKEGDQFVRIDRQADMNDSGSAAEPASATVSPGDKDDTGQGGQGRQPSKPQKSGGGSQ